MKKFLRILGISFAVFVGILLIFYLVVRIKFPPDRICASIEKLAEEQFNRHLEIGSVGISPLSGVLIENLTLHDSISAQSPPFFRVKKVQLRYRLLSVFRKRIEIRKIVIERPQLFVRRNALGVWNFSDLIQAAPPQRGATQSTKSPEVPGFVKSISFQLQEFSLTEAGIQADMRDSLGILQGQIGPVSVFLKDFQIPRLDPKTLLKTLAFDLRVKAAKSKLQAALSLNDLFSKSAMGVKSVIFKENWGLNVHLQKTSGQLADTTSRSNVTLAVQARLKPALLALKMLRQDTLLLLKNRLPQARFALKGSLRLEKPAVDLPALTFSLGNFLRARWQVSGDSLTSAPVLSLKFSQGRMDFSKLARYLKTLDLGMTNPLEGVKVEGEADFSRLALQARVDSLHTRLRVEGQPALKDVSVFYPPLQLALKKFSGRLHFKGRMRNSLFTAGIANAQFALRSFHATPAESLSVSGQGLQGQFSAKLVQNLVPRELTFSFLADSLLGATVSSYSAYKVAPTPSLSALKIQDFSGTTELQVHRLNLAPLLAGSARGHLDLSVLASANYGMNAFLQAQVHSGDLQYLYAKNLYESLPEIQFQSRGNLRSSPGFGEIDLTNFQMNVNDLVHGQLSAKAFPLKQKADVLLKNLTVDLSKVRPFLPSDIQETFQLADWSGKVTVGAQAEARLNPANDSLEVTTNGQVAVTIPYFINNEWQVSVNGIALTAEFSGSPLLLHTTFAGGARTFMLKDVLARPIQKTHFSGKAELVNLDGVRLERFDLNQPDLHVTLHAAGHVDSLSDVFPHIHLAGGFGMALPKPAPVIVDVNVAGGLAGDFRANSRQNKPQIVDVAGTVSLRKLFVEAAKTASAGGICGKIPFRAAVDLENSLLVPTRENLVVSFPLYQIFQPYYFQEDSLFRQIAIDTIRVLNYRITNFQSDIYIRDGVVLLPKTQMNLYDGNIVSQIWLNLGTGTLNDIAYAISAQVARVNSAKFPGSRGKKRKKSLIAASLHFKGKGLDVSRGLDVQGGVEVTQMGTQTTDNLLRSLDPRGVDKSIQQVRQLIRFGSKPGIISFQIRHGNLYPRIQLIQPWYLPFRISGGQVVLSRIPLSFVLNLALQSAEPAL